MSTLTVTARGQVTLRKELLEHLGVRPDGRIEVRAAHSGQISDAFNFLKRRGTLPFSIEDMNEIAARDWARKS